MLGALMHWAAPQESRRQPVPSAHRRKPGLPRRSRAEAIAISGRIGSRSLPYAGQDGESGQHPHDTPFSDSLSLNHDGHEDLEEMSSFLKTFMVCVV